MYRCYSSISVKFDTYSSRSYSDKFEIEVLNCTIGVYSSSSNQIKMHRLRSRFQKRRYVQCSSDTWWNYSWRRVRRGGWEGDRCSPVGEASESMKRSKVSGVFAHGWYRCSLFRGSARRCNSNIHDSLLTTINIWSIVHMKISFADNA